ncbi:unnamed protein product [Ceutorhynchus assimilis]|uniref:Major facilitator superfamily (MFS) profile domain-containing protein n=1 Tax=Ceutorhynchus assimilis TaxID=467358 RepID=A0A9N9M8U0_9CUCU|nr:unnamed protein product [Ceutorhynchus assimilis]
MIVNLYVLVCYLIKNLFNTKSRLVSTETFHAHLALLFVSCYFPCFIEMFFGISTTVLTVLIADLLATAGDITQTWTSPMYIKLYSNDTSENPLGKPLTSSEDSWIGSLINIGAVIGAIPTGFIADKIGRKNVMLAIAVPHMIAYFTYAFANHVYLFYIGRFINGIALGAGYTILPMYMTEITEDSNRASLSVTLNIFWTLGNFIPYAIGPYLSVRTFNLILAAIPTTFLLCFVIIGSETPHFLVQTGQIAEAEETVMRLRSCSKEKAKKEVEVLEAAFKKHDDVSLKDIFMNRGLRKAYIVSLILIFLQTMSGIGAISYYMQPIFAASGSNFSASVSTTICGACMFLSSFTTTFIVESAGKKWPLGVSCLGDALSLAVLGAFFYIKDSTSLSTDHISWLPIAGLLGYIFFFNLAYSALPWTISSELFPSNVKPISSASVAACCWMTSFFVTKFFNVSNEILGRAGTFWIYSGACLFAVLFDIIWVPETRGKNFSEIQEMLQK